MPDTETSASEEPGARKGHAGICAGAVRATGRPTAIADGRLGGAFNELDIQANALYFRNG